MRLRPPFLRFRTSRSVSKVPRQTSSMGLSFAVRPGETLCIVGESGCGKSVTALSLMGLLPRGVARVMSGTATFAGQDLLALPERALADLRGDRISMIFQEPMTSLNPSYRIGDQISEIVLRHRPVNRVQARARALEMLERVKIPAASSRLDDYPHELSGGMRQRVMIAMALANDPVLLIADEPTTALDVTIQAQIIDLIEDLQKESGTALIMITHDLGRRRRNRRPRLCDVRGARGGGRPGRRNFRRSAAPLHHRPDELRAVGRAPVRQAGNHWRHGACHRQHAVRVPVHTALPFAGTGCETTPALVELGPSHRAACHYAPLESAFAEAAG